MPRSDFNLPALYDALDHQRRERNLTWAAAAREINRFITIGRPIALSTITGLKTKRVGEGDGILQMLLWLGRTPESFIPGFADANAPRFQLTSPAAPAVLRLNTKGLHAALNARRQALGLTWEQLANQIPGYTANMLTNLARGGRSGFPHIMRLYRWLDEPAAKFTQPVVGHRPNELRNARKRAEKEKRRANDSSG
jgi:hypothetical protein